MVRFWQNLWRERTMLWVGPVQACMCPAPRPPLAVLRRTDQKRAKREGKPFHCRKDRKIRKTENRRMPIFEPIYG